MISSRKLLFAAVSVIALFSCGKQSLDYLNPLVVGSEYPKGFKVVDLITPSDCTLPPCSEERVTRLLLKNAIGRFYNDSVLIVSLSFDSQMNMIICNPEELDLDLDYGSVPWVVFSGKATDACGFLEPSWPTEESYYIHLTKFEKL